MIADLDFLTLKITHRSISTRVIQLRIYPLKRVLMRISITLYVVAKTDTSIFGIAYVTWRHPIQKCQRDFNFQRKIVSRTTNTSHLSARISPVHRPRWRFLPPKRQSNYSQSSTRVSLTPKQEVMLQLYSSCWLYAAQTDVFVFSWMRSGQITIV